MNRKIFLYIATSLDGYIARKDGNLDWLSMVEREGEDYGYAEFIQQIDTVIIGRKTYDKLLTFDPPFWHAQRKVYVVSNTKTGKDENVEFYNGKIEDLIHSLRQQEGKHIFVDGGAQLVTDMLKKDLIDTLTVSIIPTLLGEGISLWQGVPLQLDLRLISNTSFPSGLVQLTYERQR